MNWFKKLFEKIFGIKKIEVLPMLSISVDESVNIQINDFKNFSQFLHDNDYKIDTEHLSKDEIVHTFMYVYSQRWITENSKKPIFVETHSFIDHGEIKYDRIWNPEFIKSVSLLPFEDRPQTEEEMVEMYMNYVYGTRLLEELEAKQAAAPTSNNHPSLSNNDNIFKE
jgi:hypothetical protein